MKESTSADNYMKAHQALTDRYPLLIDRVDILTDLFASGLILVEAKDLIVSSGVEKFRTRPDIVIEAVQMPTIKDIDSSSHKDMEEKVRLIAQWVAAHTENEVDLVAFPGRYNLRIQTLEGWMGAGPGWWIIRGTAGEFYPCRDDVFQNKYEKVL